MECDTCAFYEWDDVAEEYYCSADMDEDDFARLMQEGRFGRTQCPFWRNSDEYAVVRHQAF